MADASKSVEIVFQGQDRLSSTIRDVDRSFGKLSGSAQAALDPIANTTKTLLKMEAALVATGAAITSVAIKMAGDFDAQFREITTLIDQPAEALDGFRREIQDYAAGSTQSMEEVTGSVYAAISAGVDYTESLEAVRAAEELAVAGKADLDDTLTVLVSSLNAYGKGMDEAGRFSDALFQTVKSGQTTLPELGSSLSRVTGLAASTGVEFEEMLSAIAALTAAGMPTSEAVTSIQAAISNMLRPTGQAAEKAAELGIEFNAAALETEGLAGVLENVSQATNGNTEEMSQLFGSVNALSAVMTLTGEGAGAFADTLDAMSNNAGATSEAFERMAGTVEQNWQRIQNAMRGLLIEIGDPLLDEFGGIQEAIAGIFNTLAQEARSGALQGIVGEIESIMQGIEDSLQDVASNLPEALGAADFSGFENSIRIVADAMRDLFGAETLTSAEGMAAIITGVGAAFEGLAHFTAGVLDVLPEVGTTMVAIAEASADLNWELAAQAGKWGAVAVGLTAALSAFSSILSIIANGGLLMTGLKATTVKVGALSAALVTGPVALKAAAIAAAVYGLGKLNEKLGITARLADVAPHGLIGMLERLRGTSQEAGLENARMVDSISELGPEAQEAQRLTSQAFGSLGRDLSSEMQRVEDALGITIGSVSEFQDLLSSGKIVMDDSGSVRVAESLERMGLAAEEATKGVEEQTEAQRVAEQVSREIKEAQSQVNSTLGEYEQKVGAASSESKKLGDEFEKGTKKAWELKNELQSIQADERIATIEATASIETARLEADAQKITSILEGITAIATSSGDAITGITGALGDTGDFRSERLLRESLETEMELRTEMMNSQKKLMEAQAEQMRARTEVMRSGESIITVSGDGLEPHLEAFMWEILQRVQTRVNAEGLNMLLGIE